MSPELDLSLVGEGDPVDGVVLAADATGVALGVGSIELTGDGEVVGPVDADGEAEGGAGVGAIEGSGVIEGDGSIEGET